jgi:hypothetical protein
MSSQKPLMSHSAVAICLWLGLLMLTPRSVKGDASFGPADPEPVGDEPVACVKIDCDSTLSAGQLLEIPILIRNSVALGGFTLEVDFCLHDLTCYGAQRGEALSHMTNQEYDWEYLSYSIEPYTDTLYRLVLYGQYDMPDGHQGVPLAPNPDYVSLVVMKFQTPAECGSLQTFFPIVFEWEQDDCSENSFSDSFGNVLYVSQDPEQYDTAYCPHGPSIARSLEFTDGGIYAIYPSLCRGDINVNQIPYETADLLLFYRYLLYGDSVLTLDPPQQSANSDVNWDEFRWSIADCIHLGRVIQHDAAPITGPLDLLDGSFRLWLGKEQASPFDTVALPFAYCSTSPEGWKSIHGVALRIGYNPDELTALQLDFSGSQLEDWGNIDYYMSPGEIRFFATPEFSTTSFSDSLMYPGSDTLLLGKIIFEVGDVDSPAFLPVSLIPDTSIHVRCSNLAGIDQQVTRMDYFFDVSGGIQIGPALPVKRGDLDLDDIPYAVADLLLFFEFLNQGPDVFWDPNRQYPAADINADGMKVTVADLVYMFRVIMHDAPPIPDSFDKSHPEPDKQTDKMVLGGAYALPGETVSLPLFFENNLPATGITFKITFDSTLLAIQNVETIGSRLESWTEVHTVTKAGALFFYALPTLEYAPLPSLPADSGVLVQVDFLISDQAPEGITIPIEFHNSPYWQLYWGHYNAYTQDGMDFIQPTTVPGWIFSGVLRGDANADGVIDIADVTYLINYVFLQGSAPDPMALGDANCDGVVDVADVMYLINYLFLGGQPPGC